MSIDIPKILISYSWTNNTHINKVVELAQRAMHWLEAGIDLQYIKDLLGHADIVTTGIYAQLSVELKRKLLEDVNQKAMPYDAVSSDSWTDDKNLVDWTPTT